MAFLSCLCYSVTRHMRSGVEFSPGDIMAAQGVSDCGCIAIVQFFTSRAIPPVSVSGKGRLSLVELHTHIKNKWSSIFLQVHKLEPEAWKHVEAIYIDIADRSQVLSKVGTP